MLEVKNLVKCYSTKGGVTVKALDNVSVKFPETGMVFLLGRSGSGKSTLLNVSGGLDKPDSGEIIVKGRSSKDFTTADFDSYRNTFIGFVFQEYNILNEFTVEQNIALALQLQSKPNDKKAVNDLLEKVDLKGLGKRKPNTLSGGQKQRVAIARALIKEPEIIMADEPTGALDSNTGKQVLDTLKKLSETKLVIIVSHDREFAEQYGDRIIELKDGQILSDVTKEYSSPKQLNENVQIVSEDTISIKKAEDITEADVKNIVEMLKKNKGEAIITAGKREMQDVKRACKINESGNKEYFAETKEVNIKEYDGKKTRFIKSRLPASRAFKMGASGLKTKPIRLIFTILLSVVAFLMFGVVSTFMLYDSNYSVSEALKEANYPSMTVQKYYSYISQSIERDNSTGEERVDYERKDKKVTLFGVKELNDKNALGNGDFAGIFNFTNNPWGDGQTIIPMLVKDDSSANINIESKLVNYYPVTSIYGFTDCGADYMARNGFTLVDGKYPTSEYEIAIPEYVANLFINSQSSSVTMETIVGKEMKFTGNNAIPSSQAFKIVGVYKVGEVPSKYDDLKDANSNTISSKEKETLIESLKDFLANSYHTIIYVHEDFYDLYKDNIQSFGDYIETRYARGLSMAHQGEITEDYQEWWNTSLYTNKTLENYSKQFKVYDLEGNPITSLANMAEDDVYISITMVQNEMRDKARWTVDTYGRDMVNNLLKYDKTALAQLGDGTDFYQGMNNLYSEDTDIDYLLQEVENWYSKLKEREFILNSANAMMGKGYSDAEFTEVFDKLNKYVNNEDGASTNVVEDFNKLKTHVNDNFKTICEQKYYYYLADNMLDNIQEKDIVELNSRVPNGDIWSIRDQLSWEGLSVEDFAIVKAVIDEKYEAITGESVSNVFNFTLVIEGADADAYKYVYFKNYTGTAGKLNVVGFFDDGQEYSNSNYLVREDFVTTYSQKDPNQSDLYWYSKEITDYVAPEDAKYNFIITLTNNTQEQIGVALNGEGAVIYKLTNTVYKQLDMFLETITSMQQIFLILGIVFGVFAALMLLNFISVSISAKRKDIGILRAVGARGSDVFKIFFAEAFIIALICFVIATIGAYVVCGVINTSMVTIVSMKLLNFQAINVALILGVSFGISLLATFFPVYFAARKSPVESIRAL